MKKFIVHILICASILFIVDKLAYFILKETPKHLYDTRLKKVLDGEMNKELIILGSSKGAGNIIASQIEKETGYDSYNLSYMGSNVIFHEFILRKLLKHNKAPKIVLLTIDNPQTLINEKSLSYRFDKLYPLSVYNEVNDELIAQNDRSILSQFFLMGRLSKAHINYSNEKPSKDNPLLEDGSMPFIRVNPKSKREFITQETTYIKDKEEKDKLGALKSIQDLCRKNNIHLYYIFNPTMSNFNSSFYKRFLELVHTKNNVFMYNESNSIYKQKSTYFDQSHLMIEGAKVFTTEISEFIKSHNP